ncbi:MAG: hypothetical protein KDI33_00175 [Halioglobus sp.]|nr:hypothetical protein [Halioglobus sp.]
MPEQIDIDHLSNWIGKQDRGSDNITPELVKRLRATLCGYAPLAGDQGSQLPLGIHWCLAQPAVPHEGLGKDGHPAKGGFLPPVPLPRTRSTGTTDSDASDESGTGPATREYAADI